MFLGRVIGTVWATRKVESMEGLKLLVVREVNVDLSPKARTLIAADAVQAGLGEIVLVAGGSAARQHPSVDKKPVDALIMAVVDNLEVQSDEELQAEYVARRDPILQSLENQPEI